MKFEWIEHYKCGCIAVESRKKDLLGYCSWHGADVLERLKRPLFKNKKVTAYEQKNS
jgi:hypothetical protein